MKTYSSFKEFYPYYLSQHQNVMCRRLHVIGTGLGLLFLLFFLFSLSFFYFFLALIFGYGLAWIGHTMFEKNKPATFDYPLYSLMGDFMMLKDVLTGKVKLF